MTRHNTYRIAICDDEPQDLGFINEKVREILYIENIKNDIFCYDSGKELIDVMKNGKNFDLILLDVIMPKQDGIELAAYLRDNAFDNSIVFISSNREMALRGYEVSAMRYLSKPIDTERLREALLYCFNNKQKGEIVVSAKGETHRIPISEIKYIETYGRGCKIVLTKETIITPMLISEFEEVISDRYFIRCHQGFIVNFRFVQKLASADFVLSDNEKVPVSKHRMKCVRQRFLDYLSAN